MHRTKLFWIQDSIRHQLRKWKLTLYTFTYSSTATVLLTFIHNQFIVYGKMERFQHMLTLIESKKKYVNFHKLQLDAECESIKIIIIIKKTGSIEANDIIGINLFLCISSQSFKNSNDFMHEICGFFNKKYLGIQIEFEVFSWVLRWIHINYSIKIVQHELFITLSCNKK